MPFQTLHHTRFAPEHRNPISAPPRKNLKVPPRPSGFSRGVVYGDMDAVAHDGTAHMGLGGAPVALNGAVILDLLVLRFSPFPAQGVPATRREQGGAEPSCHRRRLA